MKEDELMRIKKMNPEEYAGKPFEVCYETEYYYDIRRTEHGFTFTKTPFEQKQTRSFTDTFLSDWLEKPCAYGAFENDVMIGYVEGSIEQWNNRYRISNIVVFDQDHRNSGIGTVLLEKILFEAQKSGARMAVLETQSCNEKAIAFYLRHGFEVIGFDLYAFSNTDRKNHEIRIEMGRKL